jgi:anti-sigma B factor antagonist
MEGFEVASAKSGGVVILYIKGCLDTHTAGDLEDAFLELADAREYDIIINFRDLHYISSAGLGVLLDFIEEIRKNGGDIKLSNMKPRIYRVFDLLGFPALYDILDDETKALEKFRGRRHEEVWSYEKPEIVG